MFEYISENIGKKPSSLVVFLHGYNGCIEDHSYALEWFGKYLTDSVLVVPEAPEICDKNPLKKQWFGMKKYDENNIRYNPDTSVEQIFEIYDKTQNEISLRAAQVNDFLIEMQKKYKISAHKTFIIGFSQGAMLALYSALSNKNVLGGVFSLSGLLAGANKLSSEICSNPSVFLFHGMEDDKVQYKTLIYTNNWLNNHGIYPEIFSYKELKHKMCEDEIIKICKIIDTQTAERE